MSCSPNSRATAFVLIGVAVAVLHTFSLAQTATTSLRGTISDPNGAVLPGAGVTLTNRQTGFSRGIETDNDGVYQFRQLPPASYTLTVSSPGFATLRQEDVRLLVNTPATLNITMRVQTAEVRMEVKSEAPLVNTQDATLGHAFGAEQIQALPLEARNAVEILTLQPGVVFVGNNPTINPNADSRSGAVNGARSDQTNVTIDGIDDNDQLHGYAFTGAMRPTLDSLQEFRVITSNANADAGRSSGAQVALVTKSGTNSFHGSLYEYHRPTFVANDWFNLHEQSKNGLPNRPGRFIRNTFGTSVGGPIKKDRLFFFANYEGQRKREDTQISRTVPSADLRNGIIHYITCPTAPACSPGDPSNTVVALNSSQIASMDPCTNTCPMGKGPDPAVMAVMQQYPLPNTDQVGDGFNVRGFTFSAGAPAKLDTYVTKLDYNLTGNGNQRLFLRGQMQDDHVSGIGSDGPQFPGDPPNHILHDNTKGMIGGYTAVIRSNLINNLRYGYVRQGTSQAGLSDQHHVSFDFFDDPLGFSRGTSVQVPTHNLTDDITWTKGKHTLQFGGNFRMINHLRASTENSFFFAGASAGNLITTGLANKGGSFDPAEFGFPVVADFFAASYDFPMTDLAGLITVVGATYNRIKTGATLPEGTPVFRHFRAHEDEFYAQDSWRVTPSFTLTAGLRYTLLQPPYETSGTQVAPSTSLNDLLKKRATAMFAGRTYDPAISFGLSGQANGRAPYWAWDYKDIAPRVALAWAPSAGTGILRKVIGGPGKTSIRVGYGIYYDHFGEAMADTFDRYGSFGLATTEVNPPISADTAPRFTNLYTIPQELVSPPPQGGFPATPPTSFGTVSWGVDDRLKTPYSHVIDFSVTRELPRNFIFEAAYVGRLGRRLLQEEDFAMPLDIRDPKSGVDYFTAATQFAKMAEAHTPINKVRPIAYWEDLFPGAAGRRLPNGGCAFAGESVVASLTATQAMYDLFACNLHNETTALLNADVFCIPACATLNGVTQPYQFIDGQWASLYGWRSIGNSSYHAAEFTLRHHSGGLLWDFNYTFSRSIDIGSNAERVSAPPGNGISFWDEIINSWSPNQLRGPSDFDATHQINSNWVWDLPVGRDQRFGSGMGRLADAALSGWQLSGLFRWTTGFPYSAHNGLAFTTNWQNSGFAMLSGKLPRTGKFIDSDGDPNIFQDNAEALLAFRFPHPGESGIRNNLRGQGFFGIDTGVTKTWKLGESQTLKFNWEVYNITNTPRFGFAAGSPVDASSTGGVGFLDIAQAFGKYNQTLNKPRIMEFGLRYSF
jgi:carboxypeptidase family protein